MSDLVHRPDTQLDIPTGDEPATAQLVTWAQAATAAYQLAERICPTSFVPAAYRGKPVEATAAILAGAELGFGPMASLRAFHNISGTPAPAAITLRSVVQSKGHEVVVQESTAERAVVAGRRHGDTDWQTSTWTIERAQQAGYPAKNPNWRTNPTAMLVARATAEVCRWIASDAIMGMPYSAEEIRDQGPTVEARPAPRVVTAAEILGTDQQVPPASEPEGDEPAITADELLDEIEQATTQHRLDEIKRYCLDQDITDQRVRQAWSARSAQLAEVTA